MPFGFPFASLEDIYASCPDMIAPGDAAILARPVAGKGYALKNSLAVQPMEGCDADEGGAPTDWTKRRYARFAAGGAGLIWAEAISVLREGRANPRQLMITGENLNEFKNLIAETRRAAEGPVALIAQLTHSGRWSRPVDEKRPIRAQINPVLDRHQGLAEDYPIISDEELARLPALFAKSTELCMEAGFDGVDVKASHLYLMSELLGAKAREGEYGGSYEARVRLLLKCVEAAKKAAGGGIIASRINLYDGEAGDWGVGEGLAFAPEEPLRLVDDLVARGVTLINITMGTPYYNPHVNRPYARGGYEQPENPLFGVKRLLDGCALAQKRAGDVPCVATGFSYLRQFAPRIAAGLIASGGASVAGFGRGAFAYPDFANDIINNGAMAAEKCCLTCGACTRIMRAGGRPGCPVRDSERYAAEYRRVIRGK